jgi:transposase
VTTTTPNAGAYEDIVLGVDTHNDTHMAAVISTLGALPGSLPFPATAAGYVALLDWARGYGRLRRAGVEGTSSHGTALTRHLQRHDVQVIEVNRPDRATRRRRGKTDAIDAENAARAVLSGQATGLAKAGTGPVETIRMFKIIKDSAIKARTQALNQLRAVLVRTSPQLRESLAGLGPATLVRRCAQLPAIGGHDIDAAAVIVLRSLAGRILTLTTEVKAVQELMHTTIARSDPGLLDRHGVGPDTAAALLIAAGDNPDRLTSHAAFAALCGVNPIEAILRQNHPSPPQPRRRPARQQRPLQHRPDPPGPRRTHPRLRRQTDNRRQIEKGNHALSQTLRRPRGLPPHRRSPTTCTDTQPSYLTNIGASSRSIASSAFSFRSRANSARSSSLNPPAAASPRARLSCAIRQVAENVAKHAPNAVVIVVSNPLDEMTALTQLATGFGKTRVIGQAGVLDTARFTHLVAETLGVPVRSVKTLTLGSHGDTMVPVPSQCTVDGKPLSSLLDAARIDEMVKRVRNGGAEIVGLLKTGSAYYAPSAAAARMARAVAEDTGAVIPSCVWVDGEYGISGVYLGVEASLGATGVRRVVETPLTDDELAALREAAEAVRAKQADVANM